MNRFLPLFIIPPCSTFEMLFAFALFALVTFVLKFDADAEAPATYTQVVLVFQVPVLSESHCRVAVRVWYQATIVSGLDLIIAGTHV